MDPKALGHGLDYSMNENDVIITFMSDNIIIAIMLRRCFDDLQTFEPQGQDHLLRKALL